MTIKVTGLKEIQKSLKDVGDMETSREIRLALKSGAEIVAGDARTRVQSSSGKAAGSIKAGTSGARAFVRAGKGVPYYGWLDFGTRHPKKGNPRSVGPWAKSGKGPIGGRFIYPAREAKQEEVREKVETAVNAIINKAS